MSIIAKKKKSDYDPAPEGLWAAVCCDVVDLGMQTSQWGEQHKVEIRWQIEERNPQNENKPHMVVQRYTLSLHEKSRLRPMLEAWRGRKFSQEELDGFDLEKLVGANCQVQIVHTIKQDGGTFANVQAVVPSARNGNKLRVEDYIRVVDREKRAQLANEPDGLTDEDIPF